MDTLPSFFSSFVLLKFSDHFFLSHDAIHNIELNLSNINNPETLEVAAMHIGDQRMVV